MSVYKDPARRKRPWRWDLRRKNRETGEPERFSSSRGYETRKAAAAAERKFLARLYATETETDMAFLDLTNEFLDWSKINNSERHWQDQKIRINAQLKDFFDLPCSAISETVVGEHMTARAQAVSNNAANTDMQLVKSILHFGVRRKLISKNPIQFMRKLPVAKNRPYVPPQEDVRKFLLACTPHDRAMVDICLDVAGRMRSEIYVLEWADVNLQAEEPYVVLRTAKKRGGNKTEEAVFLNSNAIESFRWLKKHKISNRYVFPNPVTGKPYTNRYKWLRGVCRRAGVRYLGGFHAFRHFAASEAYDAGCSQRDIQDLLRHEDPGTTATYLSVLKPGGSRAAKAIEQKRLEWEGKEQKKITTILPLESETGG